MYILALDDERYALDSIVQELEQVFPDARIQEETKASLAIAWAKSLAESGEKLSYAFLDIQMRGVNGLEVARQLKIMHPEVVLFFCTAYSEYAFDAFGLYAKGYLLKPVQAKELLAYLVDKHGTSVTTKQIASVLWEDEPYDRKLKNKVTTIISSLRSTLREASVENILIKTWNNFALDVSKVQCDAYDFEKGDLVAINSFRGEYMANYSWAEFTTGHYTMMSERMNGV